jgi:hypothetical protein
MGLGGQGPERFLRRYYARPGSRIQFLQDTAVLLHENATTAILRAEHKTTCGRPTNAPQSHHCVAVEALLSVLVAAQ